VETLNVSELKTEQTQTEPGFVGGGSTVPAASHDQAVRGQEGMGVSASGAGKVEAPAIAPDHETLPKDDAPKVAAAKLEPVKTEAGSAEADKAAIDKAAIDRAAIARAAIAKADRLKAESFKPDASGLIGRLLIMSPGDRGRQGAASRPASDRRSDAAGKRGVAGMAAVVALAVLAGAFGGAMATTALSHFAVDDAPAATANQELEATVARIDADVLALKAGLEQTAKLGTSEFNKTSERLDKIEKAQAEPAAKLAKLSEALDKFRATPATAAATPAAAREVTGSVTPSAGEAARPASVVASAPSAGMPPRSEVARLPTVDSWNLREVAHGGALIEGRQGLYEVYAGDPVPGLGKVDAIRKQDGRWVVVTSRGLIVAR
jgi:hypothetical protein